jgi:hypothetical protein
MADLPFESPRKYGDWDDDIDELAAGFAGRPASPKPNNQSGSIPVDGSGEGEVDANVLRRLVANSGSKYGAV